MTTITKIIDFLKIAERLECEYRLTRMSDGNPQAVASHSWNLALMAIAVRPHLTRPVDFERVLELCILHDLPEAVAHDIPLHEQTVAVKQQKSDAEKVVIQKICDLLQNENVAAEFEEYEMRQSPESKLVKLLDILDTGIQHLCAKDLSYVATYNDGFYWKLFFSDAFANKFDYEPILRQIYNDVRERVADRLQHELNIDYKQFIEKDI